MKKLFAVFVSLMGLIFLSVLSALLALPHVNDNAAKKTADQLAGLPLPEHTELIETAYQAGKLVGNGNGMQYFGAILIKSELSLEELTEYYGKFAEHEWECIVENQTDADIKVIEHGQLAFQTDVEGDPYYIVYSWGSNDSVLHGLDIFDLRGH